MKGPLRWRRTPSVFVVKLGGVPMAAAPWVVSDELWLRIEPLLPKVERRFRYPGRKRLPDRQALQGILFVLYTGIAWRHLPAELGFGGGPTCHRRVGEGQRSGWSPTAATTTTNTGASCAPAGSQPRSHAARPHTAPASAAHAGSSSVPSPGSTTTSDCSSASTAATRSTRRSSPSPAASSASGDCDRHSETSS